MAEWPCSNPACKSYGRPHPHCKCGPEMAEGGEVSFCSREQSHKSGCEYFADGGKVGNFDSLTEDAPSSAPNFDDLKADPGTEPVQSFDDLQPDSGISDDNINLSPADLQAKMIKEAHPNGLSGYESPGQQAATVAEGIAQGFAGPAATLFETKALGIPEEDIRRRQEDNPAEHHVAEAASLAGSMLTGTGEAGLAIKAAEKAAEFSKLGKVGSAFIKGAISNGLIEGGDQVSKAILGQSDPGDAVNPYLAIGAVALFSGVMGGLGQKAASETIKAIEGPGLKAAAYGEQLLAGLGHAASGGEMTKGASKGFERGYKLYKSIPGLISKAGGAVAGNYVGHETAGVLLSKYVEPIVASVTNRAGKNAVPAVARWLAEGAQGPVFNVIDYANKAAQGASRINNSIDALFKAGSQQAMDSVKKSDFDKLKAYIGDGGMNQSLQEEQSSDVEGYAEGGHVEAKKTPIHADHHIAQNFPEQNVMIQAAKGRISNYLSAQRPQQHETKLAFDDAPDDREQRKNYDRALEVAVNPLGVLHHIKKGSIEPEQVKHLNALYPELMGHLQKKITERITRDQLDGKKPSYVVRQGLSMMLGTPLSGEMTPQNIQAAQAVFRKISSQETSHDATRGQQAGKAKAGQGNALTKSDRSFLTDDQARSQRQQRA